MSDALANLLEQASAGDAPALAALCRELQGPVYRLARRMLYDASDAEDAAQEILVKVITHLGDFRGEARVLTWVYAIASRHLLRFRRSRGEERALGAEQLGTALDQGMRHGEAATRRALPEAASDPEGEARVLEHEVRLSCTHGMLLVLSREERLSLVLADVLGLDGPEAAQIAGITPEAHRQRLSRARALLRPVLEERCGLVDEQNPCRCAAQIAAKRSRGMRAERLQFANLVPLGAGERGRTLRAQAELKSLDRARRAFQEQAELEPPAELLARIERACPELFG